MSDPRDKLGTILLAHARSAIEARLGLPARAPAEDRAELHTAGATFVTLTRRGHLRGCIGSLAPSQALQDDLRSNAESAAFHDPRFPPLSAAEWPEIKVEVSVLGPTEEKPCPTREACLAWISPEYGVILTSGYHRSTFLPQVWEQLPDPDTFLDHLLVKGGMSQDRWPANMVVGRYRVEKYKEPD